MPRKTDLVEQLADAGDVGFNEAAARCRGKHDEIPVAVQPPGGFNEAAARCRGKRRKPQDPDRGPVTLQ